MAVLTAPLGCSFVFTEGPPPDHEDRRYFDCSSGVAPPVLDLLWLIPWMAVIGSSNDGSVAMLGVGGLALNGTSAVRGFMKVSDCRNAKEDLEARLNSEPTRRPAREPEAWPPLRLLPPESPPQAEPAGAPPTYEPLRPYSPPEEEATAPGARPASPQ